MDEQNFKVLDSVDLTEDEDSCEENLGVNNPFHFVNCSDNFNEAVPLTNFEDSVDTSPSKYFRQGDNPNVPKPLKEKRSSASVHASSGKKVKFTSVQIKPPTYSISDTQDVSDIETIKTNAVSSDNESSKLKQLLSSPFLSKSPQLSNQTSKPMTFQNNTTYTFSQPPGKVVVIKKNNKYYKIIIPHNVMPNINQSVGPVLINIPEVGPLVINNDPQAAKKVPNEFKTQCLSLNLDAAVPKLNCTTVIKKTQDLKDLNLRDKKFCWNYNLHKKRDLDWFTATDTMGFKKTEIQRAKKCEKNMISVLTKYQARLLILQTEYEMFKNSLVKKNKVKLVKINSIIQGGSKSREGIIQSSNNSRGSKIKLKRHTNLKTNTKQKTSYPLEVVTSSIDSDDYNSDLLMTRKVVILDKNNKEVRRKQTTKDIAPKKISPGKRKRRSLQLFRDNNLSMNIKFNIKPCYVQIYRNKQVEEAYRRLCKGKGLDAERKNLKNNVRLKNPVCKLVKLDGASTDVVPNLLNEKEAKKVENTNMMSNKVIQSEELLKEEINTRKPILILTEHTIGTNRRLEFYYNEFSKSNIVFVVSCNKAWSDTILKSKGFVSAVEIGYIKLIDENLFCKFIKNGMNIYKSGSTKHYEEHNYTFLTHTL